VSAGLDGPVTTAVLVLAGQVSDDGLPTGGSLGSLWSLVSGPGPVIFTSPTSPTTAVRFEADGVFTLRLSATDGELQASDDVTFTVARVNQAPSVEAGASRRDVAQRVTLAASASATAAHAGTSYHGPSRAPARSASPTPADDDCVLRRQAADSG
jgi:hypothetical protein